MKTLILGIGNPILQNDSVGLRVADELDARIADPEVAVETAYTGGLNLLDCLRGFEKVILIDAVDDAKQLGTVSRYSLTDLPQGHSCNLHDCSLQEALQFARALGDSNLPKDIVVIGISVPRSEEFGEALSPPVKDAIPIVVATVLSEVSPQLRRRV
jgi:hydrogenase maturation protease